MNTAHLAGSGRLALVFALLLPLHACERKPPLPAELAQVACPKESKRFASSSHAVVRARGMVLVLPCVKPTSSHDLDKFWKDPAKVPAFGFTFKKRPDGAMEVSDDAGELLPSAAKARYVVEAQFGTFPSRSPTDTYYATEFKVPTPPAFATTGAETLFRCDGPERHPQARRHCAALARTPTLYWSIAVRFGAPYPDDLDVEKEVAEAYRLVAAHIVTP